MCVASCPGQAIFLVNEEAAEDYATVTLPYEFLPLPVAGTRGGGLSRSGEEICDAVVESVRSAGAFDHTNLLTIRVPRDCAMTGKSDKDARRATRRSDVGRGSGIALVLAVVGLLVAVGVAIAAISYASSANAGSDETVSSDGSVSREVVSDQAASSSDVAPDSSSSSTDEAARQADLELDPTRTTDWLDHSNGVKTVYLTFDDGPSENTEKVLDILDKYGAHVRLGSPKDFEVGLAALIRTRAKVDSLDATEMLCSSFDLVFQDLREINDGRRAAVKTASAFLYAALGVTVAAAVLLCVLAFLMG